MFDWSGQLIKKTIKNLINPPPIVEKQLKTKQMKEIKTKVFESIGEASMCWSETPKGVFDSERAKKIGDEIMELFKSITKENEELREIAEEILYWDTCPEKMKEQVRNILTPKT